MISKKPKIWLPSKGNFYRISLLDLSHGKRFPVSHLLSVVFSNKVSANNTRAWKQLSVMIRENREGARFSKAPETFRAPA